MEAERDSARAVVKAQDAYIAFLKDVEGSRAAIAISHPHLAYRESDIKRGQELRDVIYAARTARAPDAEGRG